MKKKEIIQECECHQEKLELLQYLVENPVLQESDGSVSEAMNDIRANLELLTGQFETFRESITA